jgi:hypothetical protein
VNRRPPLHTNRKGKHTYPYARNVRMTRARAFARTAISPSFERIKTSSAKLAGEIRLPGESPDANLVKRLTLRPGLLFVGACAAAPGDVQAMLARWLPGQ